MKRQLLLSALFLLFLAIANSQNKKTAIADLDGLLAKNDYEAARQILDIRLPLLMKSGNADTIAAYIPYMGKVLSNTRNVNYAKGELLKFLKRSPQLFPYNKDLVSIYFAVADFFSGEGDNARAFQLLVELQKYFAGRDSIISGSVHRIESNLGSYAMRMGNYGMASDHYRKSLALIQQIRNPDMGEVFITNNSMGIVMWYSSKLDSCLFYFDRAIASLQKMEASALNHHFRVALVQNNVANVYDELGRKEEAISNLEKAIKNYKLFIASPGQDPRKKSALISQFQSVDNLAKTYQEIGDYSKALSLLNYAYGEKQRNFGEGSPEVYKSLLQLGSQYFIQKDYAQAYTFITRGLELLRKGNNEKTIWVAEAYTSLASIMTAQGKRTEAAAYYQEAENAYTAVLNEGFSTEYLQYLAGVSLFHAESGDAQKAVTLAGRALNYATKSQGRQSLQAFYQFLNMANVYLKIKNYPESIRYSRDALVVLNGLIDKSENLLDSITLDMERPSVILIKAKAEYGLLDTVNERALKKLLADVETATAILERKKTLLAEAKDASFLMANYKELLDFTKKLQRELFELTGDNAYLNKLIFLQESSIYNRIRSRLDKEKAMQFAHIPDAILSQEAHLRESLTSSLRIKRGENGNIQAYFMAQKNWNDFQSRLSKEYPKYFNMRYADKTNNDLVAPEGSVIPGLAVVRYIFIDKMLFALVIDAGKRNWIRLPTQELEKNISSLTDSSDQRLVSMGTSYELYRELWQPIEKYITSKRVTIIPDGILYYLSFDMLTVQKPATIADWAMQSLLYRYAISYHYSLMAISPSNRKTASAAGFTAFAPGFSDDEKGSYRATRKSDTLNLDQEYLSLIPLPFSIALSRKIQQELGGDIFIGNRATHSAFTATAGQHSIIQLSTHAEANNQFPQYSRLIFAKNLSNADEDNSLYLNDIYDCDMRAELTVLTACETGRPGFFDGEGMISMAHAFHYAGSESLLTGLWKIDEQSSALITEYFYRNLQKGLPKDIALQRAQIRYLESAEGRMISPRYWAGLAIMGEISPVEFAYSRSSAIYWIAAGVALVMIAALLYWKFRRIKRVQ